MSLKSTRLSRGFTTKQLADMVGCSIQHISVFESDTRKPENMTLSFAIKLSDALKVDVRELLN